MSGKEREAIRQALLECGSLESLFQKLALSESEESRQQRLAIEHGPHHPSDEELYHYVLGWLKESQEDEMLDHLLLCRVCLEEVFRIRRIESDTKAHVLQWTDETSWLDQLKGFVSNLSFPVMIHPLAFEGVRGPKDEDTATTVKVGDPLTLFVESPANGYMTVFHLHEGTGEVSLVFPQSEEDQSHVSKGQEISLTGEATTPVGRQGFKAIWTKGPLRIHKAHPRTEEWSSVRLTQDLFEELALLVEGEFIEAELNYEVVE
jgi:hypothetical protein